MSATRAGAARAGRVDGAATHRRIVEAALEVLAERGWRNASVDEVAKRAGATRGAVQHHFKDKNGLFAASVQHILDLRIEQIEALAAIEHTAAEDRTHRIVQTVVEMHVGPLFAAALQLCVAAANDDTLRNRIAAMELEVGARGFWALIDLLELDGSKAKVRTTVQAFLDAARGLGLAAMLNDDSARRRQVTKRWVELIDEVRSQPD
ncbi:TetR/AcrR family transcriptional regulator [Nocardia brasiliensis]|uniref:TetR/AcrR family transcriptional regulator n=1 Tax=Nocardia brasiliensis TaxID=37326 RepID=UPI00367301DA